MTVDVYNLNLNSGGGGSGPAIAWNIVQAVGNSFQGATSPNNIAIELAARVGVGHMLAGIGIFSDAGGPPVATMSDDGVGGTWVIAQLILEPVNTQWNVAVYGFGWSTPPTIAILTVTGVGYTGNNQFNGLQLMEISGNSAGDPLNASQAQVQAAPGVGVDGCQSGAGTQTPSVPNCLIVGAIQETASLAPNPPIYTAGTGFAIPPNGQVFNFNGALMGIGNDIAVEFEVQTVPTPVNASFTGRLNNPCATMQMIFKPGF
jgi:hypothetical protein